MVRWHGRYLTSTVCHAYPRRADLALPSSLRRDVRIFPGADSMRTSSSLALMLAASSAIACMKEPPPPADTTASASAAPASTALPSGEGRLAVDGGRIW